MHFGLLLLALGLHDVSVKLLWFYRLQISGSFRCITLSLFLLILFIIYLRQQHCFSIAIPILLASVEVVFEFVPPLPIITLCLRKIVGSGTRPQFRTWVHKAGEGFLMILKIYCCRWFLVFIYDLILKFTPYFFL